jgi:hypothetical protein
VIVRGPRLAQDFTIVSNAVIRDSRLSYRARGVLIDILSRPDNWRTDFKSIARGGSEGESAIRTVLAELRAAGYLVQRRTQGERGRWVTTSTVYDQPQENPQVGPSVGFPSVGEPDFGKPTPVPMTTTNDFEEVGHPDDDSGLPAGSPLRVDRENVRPRPIRQARKLTPAKRQECWQRFRVMDLGDFEEDMETRGAAFLELELDHGVTEPDRWAQSMIDRGHWDGFCASFGLGQTREAQFTQSAA